MDLTSRKTLSDLLILGLVTITVTILVWLPHVYRLNIFGLNFNEGFNTIYRNFDGLEYIIIAKTFYRQDLIVQLPQSLPHTYYASHFPFYSILILFFAPLFGLLKSMIFVALISTIMAAFSFYFLVRDFKLTTYPLWLSIIFLILPARWLIVHSVGSSEPLFIFLTIVTLYFFMKYEQSHKWAFIYLAGFFGLLTQLTRPPGILIFISLSLYILWKVFSPGSFFKNILRALSYYPLLLIPMGLLSVFYYYSVSYNDFFAYFHSGDNIHLTFPPFQVFNKHQFWVGEIWLEDIIYIFILGLLGGIYLFKQKLYPLAFFVLTYLAASMFVVHRDISRYVLPIFPFVLIAFEKVLISREFKIILVIVSLAIYLYAQNFLIANTGPYPNPEAFN